MTPSSTQNFTANAQPSTSNSKSESAMGATDKRADPSERSGRRGSGKGKKPCDFCKRRKLKCIPVGDGTVPRCELCQKAGNNCTYFSNTNPPRRPRTGNRIEMARAMFGGQTPKEGSYIYFEMGTGGGARKQVAGPIQEEVEGDVNETGLQDGEEEEGDGRSNEVSRGWEREREVMRVVSGMDEGEETHYSMTHGATMAHQSPPRSKGKAKQSQTQDSEYFQRRRALELRKRRLSDMATADGKSVPTVSNTVDAMDALRKMDMVAARQNMMFRSSENKIRMAELGDTLFSHLVMLGSTAYGSNPTRLIHENFGVAFEQGGRNPKSVELGSFGEELCCVYVANGARISNHSALLGRFHPISSQVDLPTLGRERETPCRTLVGRCVDIFSRSEAWTEASFQAMAVLLELQTLDGLPLFLYNSAQRAFVQHFRKIRKTPEGEANKDRLIFIFSRIIGRDGHDAVRHGRLPILNDDEIMDVMGLSDVPPRLFLYVDALVKEPSPDNLNSHHEYAWASLIALERALAVASNVIFRDEPPCETIERIVRSFKDLLDFRTSYRQQTIWEVLPSSNFQGLPTKPPTIMTKFGPEHPSLTDEETQRGAFLSFGFFKLLDRCRDIQRLKGGMDIDSLWRWAKRRVNNEIISMAIKVHGIIEDDFSVQTLGWRVTLLTGRMIVLPGEFSYLGRFVAEDDPGSTRAQRLQAAEWLLEALKLTSWSGGRSLHRYQEATKALAPFLERRQFIHQLDPKYPQTSDSHSNSSETASNSPTTLANDSTKMSSPSGSGISAVRQKDVTPPTPVLELAKNIYSGPGQELDEIAQNMVDRALQDVVSGKV